MISLIGAVVLITVVGVVFYVWHRVSSWRKRLRTETREAQDTLHNTFDVLRDDIAEQFDGLSKMHSKKRRAEEEERVEEHIEEGLEVAEQFVQKEVEDIEKETD